MAATDHQVKVESVDQMDMVAAEVAGEDIMVLEVAEVDCVARRGVTGVAARVEGNLYTYGFMGTDPEADTLRYGVDWNHDGTVDEWVPATGYVSSGSTSTTSHIWTAAGSVAFQALAQDSREQSGAWTQYTVDVIPQCTPGTGTPITGYGWSENIGWIDLNCENTNSCSTSNFGLAVASSGIISGCAWSDNLGWISASQGDLSECPSGVCQARINNDGSVTGWMRVLNATGWDGWIGLSGSWTPTVSLQTADSSFSGFAWAETPVGWIDFQYAHTTYTPCMATAMCSNGNVVNSCTGALIHACGSGCYNGACNVPSPSFNASVGGLTGHLQVKPTLVRKDAVTHVFWNLSNASSCLVTSSATPADTWGGLVSPVGGATTSPIIAQTTFALFCTPLSDATSSPITEMQMVNVVPVFRER